MQITVERSGGYTGIPLTLQVDTATLPSDQAAQLRQLVEAADFFHLTAPPSISAQPDRFEYEITVREGDRQHRVTVGDMAMPEPLKPLLGWLMTMASQQ
ncbi:hypothetical protein IQ254_15065 [Nodosilinea sp. LEGE 07088]|uniref:protealysin inhibitor emfourin n=1 Tax=Nodosilinea sp. LEGE 07088 TaxID=2777968 RepID=UPI00188100E4|nr:protealysin inhibitor emfourin [Nodosilinea sp. LEGE 07088]MBE9138494.1 hypothetical protein [Nodosilinea sp. LEGE 07088]